MSFTFIRIFILSSSIEETNKHLLNRHSIYYCPITIKIYTLFNLLLYLAIELSHIYSVCPVCWQYQLSVSIHSSGTHPPLPSSDSFNILYCTHSQFNVHFQSTGDFSKYTHSIVMYFVFILPIPPSFLHISAFFDFFLIAAQATTVTSLNNYPKALSKIPIK